jgi:hypothetical protein
MNGWQSVYEKPEHKRSTVPPVDTDFKNAWEERNKLFTESNFVSTQIEYLTLKESRTDKQEADLNELLTKRIGIEKRQEELQDYLSKLQRK